MPPDTSPAARLELIERLLSSGLIGKDSYKRLLLYGEYPPDKTDVLDLSDFEDIEEKGLP